MSYRTFVVAAIVVTLGASCHEPRIERTDVETFRFDAADNERIEVRVDDGRIDVVRGEPDTVEVIVTKRARAHGADQADALLAGVRVVAESDGTTLRVVTDTGQDGILSLASGIRADVELRVPEDSPSIDVLTRDGRVVVENISGTIVAESGDGRVRASNTSGALTLRSKDGSIRATDIDGSVDAATDDGRIELSGRFDTVRAVTADGRIRIRCEPGTRPSADWTIRSFDGSIGITLAEPITAMLEAAATDGRVEIELPGFEGSVTDRRLKGKLGAGEGPLILVTTMEGRISFTES